MTSLSSPAIRGNAERPRSRNAPARFARLAIHATLLARYARLLTPIGADPAVVLEAVEQAVASASPYDFRFVEGVTYKDRGYYVPTLRLEASIRRAVAVVLHRPA